MAAEVTAMASLFDLLVGRLDPDTLARLGERIGTAPAQTRQAVEAAVPLLLDALQKNLGAAGGSIAEDLAALLGQRPGTVDPHLLDRLLGEGRAAVEAGVAKATGLGGAAITQLLAMLTPLVLGVAGQSRREAGADSGGLGDVVVGALNRLGQAVPDLGALVGALLSGKR
jgi:hypothetical protein